MDGVRIPDRLSGSVTVVTSCIRTRTGHRTRCTSGWDAWSCGTTAGRATWWSSFHRWPEGVQAAEADGPVAVELGQQVALAHPVRAQQEDVDPPVQQGLHAESLRGFCEWARKRGYLDCRPLEGMAPFDTTPRARRRAMTVEEITRFLGACPPYLRLLYETAFLSGLRAG